MFHRIDGDLHAEQVPLQEIADTYGTPCFVYSAQLIRAAYQDFDRALAGYPHAICYAVKANSNLAVLQILAELGAGFDIVSGGELARVIKAGGDPGRVVFSGVGKQDWEINAALDAGVHCLNVESASELDRVSRLAAAKSVAAPVSIRVNPDVDPDTHPYIATGLKENKFGVSVETARALYQAAALDPNLNVIGIDCHIGSQITRLEPFLDALTRVLALVDDLGRLGITLSHIDLGGGIGVRYSDEKTIDIDAFASAMGQAMSGRQESLMFEPGRMIVANAGVLLTRVNTLKENEGRQFAVVDAAMNDLIRPALYQAYQAVEPVLIRPGETQQWDIVGPVCESGDFLAKERQLSLEEGDLISIMSSGAYGFAMSSNYNSRGRAAEILVDDAAHYCVRQRESIEDLFRLESLKPV